MQKKWVRMLFRRRVAVISSLLLQILLMVFMLYSSSQTYQWMYYLLYVISAAAVLHIISTGERATYKLLWSITIFMFPLFGGLLYLMVRVQGLTMAFRRRLQAAESKARAYYVQDEKTEAALLTEKPAYCGSYRFLKETCGFCAYPNTGATYLSPGEKSLEKLLEALEKAERFIFLEYFIIQEGRFWNSILDVLRRKAKAGVDVRVIYDDMGCFFLLPLDYQKYLENMGIRCVVFNKFRPVLSTLQNHRDHRKIAVIDGKWAFTGGVNLADEYINEKVKHGHWKDAAICISGSAVNSFTIMFLTMWQALTAETDDMERYLAYPEETSSKDGFIIPYCDSPIDNEYVGERVYMNMINGAKKYLFIKTPYLILDDTMVSALILSAKNGVDVRILTPGVPDKWYVHMTTRSYYKELLLGGVQIYEYTPGFIHSKVMAADDEVATIGTVNMDFRSLYLHFECGAWLCGSQMVAEIREDFLKTLQNSKKMTLGDCKLGIFKRLVQIVLRLLSPLM